MNPFYADQIDKQLNETLKEKTVNHRQRFSQLFKARYLELLPSLIKYNSAEKVSVDFLKVEVALRNGYDVIIGETKNINITITVYLRQSYYKEISYDDSCKSGNFVVLRNKTLNYISDYAILDHYVQELSEIVLSRFSLSMQVKITTLFLGEPNDETLNQ